MSLVIVELAGSRQFSRGGGSYTGSRTYKAYDDEGLSPTISEIMNSSLLPSFNDSHPDTNALFATSWDLKLSDARENCWEIVWNYEDDIVDIVDLSPTDPDPTPEDYTDISVNIGVVIIDAWKSNPTMPANLNDPARTDIGGTALHEEGYALSLALPVADITITGMVFASGFNGSGALTTVGKRNDASWLGFDTGSVLFKGIDVRQTAANSYQLSYHLAWDSWYHLRQQCERDTDGKPLMDRSSSPPELDVFFKQPFPLTADFSFLPLII